MHSPASRRSSAPSLLEAVVAAEDRFGMVIPDDDWARFHTVGDAVNYLVNRATDITPVA